MLFDFEGFGERNAIRSALGGQAPGGFDRAEVLRLLGLSPKRRSARAEAEREPARAA